jgi:spermidine synthase
MIKPPLPPMDGGTRGVRPLSPVRVSRASFLVIGMTSIVVQIVFLREFLSAFQGNELIIGIVLACWMGLTGCGALMGRKRTIFSLRTTLLLLALLPTGTMFGLRVLRNVVFTPGSMIGLSQSTITTLVTLAPFCLLSGYAYVAAVGLVQNTDLRQRIAFGYAWEAVGSVAGGVLFNVLLARVLDTFSCLALLASVDLLTLWILLPPPRWGKVPIAAACVVTLIATLCSALTLDPLTHAYLFPGQEVVYFRDTPYGNLTITRQREQLNLFENNALAFSTDDPEGREESVHFAMAQRSGRRTVLVIGGGISGILAEILKYDIDHIDYVEQNPWILDIGRRFARGLDDPRISAVPEDGRMFVRHTTRQYDAVLVNVPDPATLQLNRYYSLEFFQEVRDRLRPGGVLSLSLLPGVEYQGKKARDLQSVVYATLRRVFPYLLIVPGQRNYFIASDAPLHQRIAALIDGRKVSTAYVNKYYIDDALLEQRSKTILAGLDTVAPANSDFRPVCAAAQLAYWTSYFGRDPGQWVIIGASVALLGLFWTARPIGSTILASGFTASSMEVTLLAAFQVLYGSLFEMTGLLITTFMGGLAFGAFLSRRFTHKPTLGMVFIIQTALAAACAVVPGILLLMGHTGVATLPGQGIFLGLTFGIASLTAGVFSLGASIHPNDGAERAASLYGLDLLGSAGGALLTGVYVIPALGILRTSIFAGIVSAAGAAICLSTKRRL